MIKAESGVEFDGDDVWIGSVLISKCFGNEEWTAFLDNDVEKEFETLELAVTYCLEHNNE
ncbi:hypothetical protein ACT4VJ_14530 [Acinetobacter baumannii]|mgnify:CR=1 FL=1|uniref:hypothetical protein n=1 Tax=Acinetobacter calcoaceticus/baumannii complex TaxID=909768 RepID=UPI0002E8E0EA|nr:MULTISPECIES: hypothetical protein [Acinetobacter calcoaceticus/baumannii complex]AUM27170.1 hypothetical protein BVD86_09845 [Acinetobacter pittii]EXG29979.1 hypothetical protein J733_3115 [Acinetobacter sp. 263903-2]EXR42313.1 hypothetical protein J655_1707 [Acinetobacter sp. 1294243]MBE4723899.1 hypothetical protein [Acinetobacter baumannii]MCG9523263.1 hypothetical protein [Acinetobacter pittii]